jgi:hypothetical protein
MATRSPMDTASPGRNKVAASAEVNARSIGTDDDVVTSVVVVVVASSVVVVAGGSVGGTVNGCTVHSSDGESGDRYESE